VQLLEHFDGVVALDDGGPGAPALAARLRADGIDPVVVDLGKPQDWGARFAGVLGPGRGGRSTGVVVLAPVQEHDGELWRPQDRLVERLECTPWHLAWLGHGDGIAGDCTGLRPEFIACETTPAELSAIALRGAVLEGVLPLMPERSTDGPLSPTEWLTIAAWLSQCVVAEPRTLFAWPPLARPAGSQPTTASA